jgi:uncharacterized protein (UPF0333 family)
MKKEFLFLMLAVLIFSGCVSAVSFQKNAINDAIIPEFNQPAKFSLTITEANSGTYHFYTFADVSLLPEGNFQLSSGDNSMDFYVYSQERLKSYKGFYTFVYNLKENSGASDTEDRMTIKIVPLKDAIEISSETISPDSGTLTFYVQNRENVELKNISAKFVSVFFNIEKTFDLKPLEKTEITIPLNKEETKRIKAGLYLINSEFNSDSGKIQVEGKIYWAEKKWISTQSSEEGFFVKKTAVKKINVGNVLETVEISIEKNIISRLFTSFNIEPSSSKREGFGVEYTWAKLLNPADSFSVEAKTNYILPWILLILAIVIIYCYIKYSEKRIEVRKSVSHVKTKGGEFALKVRILVKAKKAVQNVSLVDRMPAMTKIYEKLWTTQPKKIDELNRRIYWDIGDMHAGEERVFSYVIYSKIGVLGKFTLPEALAILEHKGKIHEVARAS